MSEVVRLRTGQEVLGLVVLGTYESLEELLKEKSPVTFLDIVMACRDSKHVVSKKSVPTLLKMALIDSALDDGRVHITSGIRHVVLASVEGDTIANMRLVSPLAKDY